MCKNLKLIWLVIGLVITYHQLGSSQSDIELDGQFILGGDIGSVGSFVRNNGDGTMSWGLPGGNLNFEFDRSESFIGNANWTVPPGVTEVMFEMWGAGGCGDYSGGGSGAYLRNIITVTPGTNMVIQVGAGGVHGSANEDGDKSQIVYNGTSYWAEGGNGAVYNSTGNVLTRGEGANGSNGVRAVGYSVSGNDGHRAIATSTVNASGGEGADAPFTSSGGRGSYTGSLTGFGAYTNNATDGNAPGGGGGGGWGDFLYKGSGGSGMVILYYNQ